MTEACSALSCSSMSAKPPCCFTRLTPPIHARLASALSRSFMTATSPSAAVERAREMACGMARGASPKLRSIAASSSPTTCDSRYARP